MHISDGVLSPELIAATTVAGAGVLAFSLKSVKPEDISKLSLMTAVFFVGSTVHLPVGPTSVHLLLTGFIGLVVGRQAAVSILIALLLQLFLLHFGGISSLGANVLIESLPAMVLGMILRPRLAGCGIDSGSTGGKTFLYGFIAGFFSVLGSVVLLGVILMQSNTRFAMGPFSTFAAISVGHIPVMFVEGFITGFAVQFLVKVRPEFFHLEPVVKEKHKNHAQNHEEKSIIEQECATARHVRYLGDHE